MIATLLLQAGNPMGFVFAFIVFIIVAAIVILGVRWLCGLAGLAPSSPLVIIIYLVLLLFLLCGFFYYGGSYFGSGGGPFHR
jgi:hypothetical protein